VNRLLDDTNDDRLRLLLHVSSDLTKLARASLGLDPDSAARFPHHSAWVNGNSASVRTAIPIGPFG
jgi:hypothetical protein